MTSKIEREVEEALALLLGAALLGQVIEPALDLLGQRTDGGLALVGRLGQALQADPLELDERSLDPAGSRSARLPRLTIEQVANR